MAFPQVAASNSSVDTTTGTTHVISLPAGIAAGDLLLVALFGSATDATPNTAMSGWSLLRDVVITNAVGHLAVFYKIADGSEGASVNATVDTSEDCAAVSYRITGWHGTTPPAISTGVIGTTGSPNPDSLSPSWGAEDTLWIVIACSDTDIGAIAAYPTNYSSNQVLADTNTSAGGVVAMATRELNASSEDPGVFTAAAVPRSAALTLAVRPAASVPDPYYYEQMQALLCI